MKWLKLVLSCAFPSLLRASSYEAPESSLVALNDRTLNVLSGDLKDSEWLVLLYRPHRHTLPTNTTNINSYADWCPACRSFKPTFYEVADWASKEHPKVRFATANYETSQVLMMRFFVSYLPSVFQYHHHDR